MKRELRRKMFVIGALLVPLLFAGIAPKIGSQVAWGYNGKSSWTAIASTCAIDESALGEYATQKNQLKFRPGSTVTLIEAFCNVTNPLDDSGNPGWNDLSVSCVDSDGPGGATVRAKLFQSCSNSPPIAIATAVCDEFGFGATSIDHVFSFDAIFGCQYYVRLTLNRPNTSTNISATHVGLGAF